MVRRILFGLGSLLLPLAVLAAALPALSQSALQDAPLTEFTWSGAIGSSSVTLVTRLMADGCNVRVVLSANPDYSNPIYSPSQIANTAINNRVLRYQMSGLQPDTLYYYTVECQGVRDSAHPGQFRTLSAVPFSFSFAAGCCVDSGFNNQVFTTIGSRGPRFFLVLGDMYRNLVNVNDPDLFRSAYNNLLISPVQAALYNHTPIVYVWDDADYGVIAGDRTAPGRQAARQVYQEYVPHYGLPAGSGDVPIYQAFTVGRVRFILTDLRSERDPNTDPDDDLKSMMGQTQKQWFFQQLLAAKDRYPVIIWASSVPWIDDSGVTNDTWYGFRRERAEIANFIAGNDIRGLILLTGHAHMLAIDDGRNNRYASDGGVGFPVMNVGSLEQPGELLGGPYSEGMFPGSGQFGFISVIDSGGSQITVTLSGRSVANQELVRLELPILASSTVDYGDLPDSFQMTTRAQNGAGHVLGSVYLGSRIDPEDDGQPSETASGDDLPGPGDEDGVLPTGVWRDGANGGVVEVVAHGRGYLNAWMDGNRNGAFDPAEHVISNTLLNHGVHTVTLDLPPGTIPTGNEAKAFYFRFRYFAQPPANPAAAYRGVVDNGEVEDYRWAITRSAVTISRLGVRSHSPWWAWGLAVLLFGLGVGISWRQRRFPASNDDHHL